MNSVGTKGMKQVADEDFNKICAIFDSNARTKAVKLARPIVKNRADKTIYQDGKQLGLSNGMTLKAIAVDGFSIVNTTPATQQEVDAWVGSRHGEKKA